MLALALLFAFGVILQPTEEECLEQTYLPELQASHCVTVTIFVYLHVT